MSDKNEWKEIYKNFKFLYPNLMKETVGYCPYGYMSIMIYLSDDFQMIYNEVDKRGKIVERT